MQIGASFGVSTVITTLVGFPTTQYSADTIVTYIMDIGTTRFEMGYACTIAVFLFALMFLTNFVISSALRRFSPVEEEGGTPYENARQPIVGRNSWFFSFCCCSGCSSCCRLSTPSSPPSNP